MMGRLTRDPEIRYSANTQQAIANFTLAVDRRFARDSEQQADFFNHTAFGKTAEFCEKYLRQGTKVVVESHIQNNNYTNKNGEKVYSVQFLVDSIEFAESKAVSDAHKQATQQAAYQSGPAPQPQAVIADGAADEYINMPIMDELPF